MNVNFPCAVPIAAEHRGHRVGEVLEPEALRREQPRRTEGDRLADLDLQLQRRRTSLRATAHQRMLPRKPRIR